MKWASSKPIAVAIGIVVREQKILIARRPASATLGGLWEFPGGKCKSGEEPSDCLLREIREETGLDVGITRALPVIEWRYPAGTLRLHPFICHIVRGDAQSLWAEELRWVCPGELQEYEFPEANRGLIEQLVRLFPPNIDR